MRLWKRICRDLQGFMGFARIHETLGEDSCGICETLGEDLQGFTSLWERIWGFVRLWERICGDL